MRHAPVWLFDLDNTLHNASAHIFPHINQAMTRYLQTHLQVDEAEANRLRMAYWQRYGATLLGLMRHHGTDPAHFLQETHRFERLPQMVVFDRALRSRLARLPGRKYVFSNGPQAYARAVLEIMGMRQVFDGVYGIEQFGLIPKPDRRAFHRLLRRIDETPRRCVLVEDSLENLRTAKKLGMGTVWISHSRSRPAAVDVKLGSILQIGRAAAGLRR